VANLSRYIFSSNLGHWRMFDISSIGDLRVPEL
jgi:hypothetical protein